MPAMTASDTNFERTFADLAYARMRDKAPTLLDHLIGFQLIDKNEEETHAVGVFGFKIGKDWVYAPMFFINGELKGHELLYVKSQDAFVPLTEEWVNYILHRRPNILGKPEPRKPSQIGLRQPDFDVFARPPYSGSKYANVVRPGGAIAQRKMEEWAADFTKAAAEVSPLDERFKKLDTSMSLTGALRLLPKQAAVNLFVTMKQDAKFAEAIMKFYDPNDLVKAAEEGQDKSEPYEMILKFDEAPYRDTPKGMPIVIINGDTSAAMKQGLSDSDKEKLMKDKYVVKDPRTKDNKTRIYKTQLSAELSSPHCSGVYEVLTSSGERKTVVVLTEIKQLGWTSTRERDATTAVIDTENKQFGNFYNTDVLTTQFKGALNVVKGAKDPSSLDVGDTAVLFNPVTNRSTGIFSVSNRTTDTDGFTSWSVYGCNSLAPTASRQGMFSRGMPLGQAAMNDPAYNYPEVRHLVFTDKEGAKWSQVGESLFVPKGFKVFVIKKLSAEEKKRRADNEKKFGPSINPGESSDALSLGTSTSILASITKAAAAGKSGVCQAAVKTTNFRDYFIHINGNPSEPMSKYAALRSLICQYGLDEEDAVQLVTEAKPRIAKTYWLKSAQQPMSPTFTEPPMGTEKGYNIPVQYPYTDIQPLQSPALAQNREYYYDDRSVDTGSRQDAENAATQGQKEVLDTAVITGLIKTVDSDARVDSYISDLLLGLDRVGRILFMFYWHNEKFKERYGQQDMVELEDNLRNVFKNLGELTLFLKQKTIESDPTDGSEVELESVTT